MAVRCLPAKKPRDIYLDRRLIEPTERDDTQRQQ
jgi:hypothetical protein